MAQREDVIETSRRGRWIDYHLAVGAGARIAGALGAARFPATVDQPPGRARDCEVPR